MKRTIACLMLAIVATAAPTFNRLVLAGGKDEVQQGEKYFVRYCASCHGMTGAGDGPVAHSLTKAPANLRLLSDKYGWPLPAARLADLIDGREAVRAHGTAEMPVWGERFYAQGEGERGEVGISEVLRKIVAYLETIQDRRRAMR